MIRMEEITKKLQNHSCATTKNSFLWFAITQKVHIRFW